MSNYKLSRRLFITSSGVTFMLPLLESLLPRGAFAAGLGDPRRYVGIYFPNGSYNRQGDAVWYPNTGTMSAGNLPPIFQPFAANVGDFSVPKFIGNTAQRQNDTNFGGRQGHISAVTTHFTGEVITSNIRNTNSCLIKSSSFDQLVVKATGKASINIAGGGINSAPDNTSYPYGYYLSYNQGQAIEPTMNPVDLYNRILRQVVVAPPAPAPSPTPAPTVYNAKKSILDSAIADIRALQAKLGKKDVAKLDDYLTSIRAMELKIVTASPGTATPPRAGAPTCASPASPPASLNNSDPDETRPDYIERMRAMYDMIAFAFKCDITRAVTINMDGDGDTNGRLISGVPSSLIYNGVDIAGTPTHSWSHAADSANGRAGIITRDRLYCSFVFGLINQLKAATDPSGSPILDNTVIDAGHSIRDASHQDGQEAGLPMFIGGGRNFMSPGNAYDLSAYDRRDLFYTWGNLLNLNLANFQGSTKIVKI
jgi:hypothetical protein